MHPFNSFTFPVVIVQSLCSIAAIQIYKQKDSLTQIAEPKGF
ncbi:hypothetical protein SLEP1_g52953 [Rubroshorea leprosula]|uniref:Uncharacterized protein n=1 Tax=Rubroshorea leprosula TaxID=152421 RepID=A0AAV5MBQ5_9ROSI|nr:hypothetical protein SLEP1_g52953 [Rubroshorea leprosula]